jgi:urease accessory protein
LQHGVELGLPARNEPFESGELRLNFELWRDHTPVFLDRMRLSGTSNARHARWGLAGFEAIGTLLAYPATRAHVELCRAVRTETESAVTLVDGVLVCRALASQAEPIKQWFVELWRALRPELLGRPAHAPRIWAT